jgi:DNA repair protein RadD
MGLGWIYEHAPNGELKSAKKRFFKQCVFELPLTYMIKHRYLTVPVKVDIPVTCYDFSELTDQEDRSFTIAEVEEILKSQKRLTPLIIKNIIDITERYERKGVMIFSATVKHAEEIMSYLPENEARLVIGETDSKDRDQIIEDFKKKKIKYLVNVSVLTTGFNAPHVDVIAILRPTESNSLYQQIVGRGLRLCEGKKDCYVLDYTGMGHDIYAPDISEKRPAKDTMPVLVECPVCAFENNFWGYAIDGEVIEHFGRKCRGAAQDPKTFEWRPCGYRFRSKICHACGNENDITAKACENCKAVLIDADAKLKQAKLSKNAHVLTPDRITFEERKDRNSNPYLEIRYYDADAQYVSEAHFFNNPSSIKKFNINFLRSHLRRPELAVEFTTPAEAVKYKSLFRLPSFIIARKQDKFWKITEKVFAEEL